MKKQLFLPFIMIALLLVTSCEDVASNRRYTSTDQQIGVGGGSVNGSGNGVNPEQDALDDAVSVDAPTVEIRHLIEPKVDGDSEGGTYLKKLTIPKNYNGLLYVAGINISTLADKNIKVRFKFGTDSVPKDIPATVSTATGLTPQTNIEVLIMDLRSRPFNDIQLIYDLFDYNDYDFSGTNSNKLAEPIQHNRNKNLFCRGLSLKDDPTFQGDVSTGCTQASDVCKYAFAKVVDKGLVTVDGAVETPISPTDINAQSGSNGYYGDTNAIKAGRCLPDDPTLTTGTYVYKYDDTFEFTSYFQSQSISGITYKYEGPYRLSNTALWEIQSFAAENAAYGLYKKGTSGGQTYFYNSKLFPLYTKFDFLKDTEYLGAQNAPDEEKTLQTMASNGESLWMDGCNARASSVDSQTGEHVGSCSVTATIAIIATDDDGVESEIDITNEVKLQLVKPAALDINGDNVLLSSFQSCTSSGQCGSDECCISKRCMDKSIVSQCVEDMPAYGLLQPGSSCQSDHECASLCCSQTTGRCAVHDTLQDPPVLCSKASGQRCIAKEWCMKHPVTRCFIINTGMDTQGATTCALRCYTFEEHGDCENGICKPPPQPTMPSFDPNDPNRCAQACDPPDFSNGYFDFSCGN